MNITLTNSVYFFAAQIILIIVCMSAVYEAVKLNRSIFLIPIIALSVLPTVIFRYLYKDGVDFLTLFYMSETTLGMLRAIAVIYVVGEKHIRRKYSKMILIGYAAFMVLGIVVWYFHDNNGFDPIIEPHLRAPTETSPEGFSLTQIGEIYFSIFTGVFWLFWVYIYAGYLAMSILAILAIRGGSGGEERSENFFKAESGYLIPVIASLFGLILAQEQMYIMLSGIGLVALTALRFRLPVSAIEDKRKREEEHQEMRTLARKAILEAGEETEEHLLAYFMKVVSAQSGAFYEESEDSLIPKSIQGYFPPTFLIDDVILNRMNAHEMILSKLKTTSISKTHSYIGEAFSSNKPLLIEEAEEDNRVPKTTRGAFPLRSVMAIPVIDAKGIRSIVALANKSEGTFSPHDLKLATFFSEEISASYRRPLSL